jgi:hypothetical protein
MTMSHMMGSTSRNALLRLSIPHARVSSWSAQHSRRVSDETTKVLKTTDRLDKRFRRPLYIATLHIARIREVLTKMFCFRFQNSIKIKSQFFFPLLKFIYSLSQRRQNNSSFRLLRSRKPRIRPRDSLHWPRSTLYQQKLALASPTSGSR